VDPKIPDTLPQPFLDIARHCSLCDAVARWSISEISARLNPMAAAAAAGTTAIPVPSQALASPTATVPPSPAPHATLSVSPLSVPLSTEPPIPAAKLQTPRANPPRKQESQLPQQRIVLPNYVIPLLAGVLVLVAIYALPKILRHRDVSSSAEVSAAPPVVQNSKSPEVSSKPEAAAPRADTQSVVKSVPQKAHPEPTRSSAPSSAPAVLRSDDRSPSLGMKPSRVLSGKGEVLDQVLPQVSAKALATIHGTVRIAVRAHADAAGSVTNVELDAPGASKYFAGLAEQAARDWTFSPPERDQRSVPSEWLIRFEFTQSGVKAFPSQITP
jgi:hypothetical protein